MNKTGLFAMAAQVAPKFIQVRRRTWIMLGVGMLVLFGLLIWAAIALAGWFFAQLQSWGAAAPGAVQGALATMTQQVEHVVPGVQKSVSEYVPILKPSDKPQREVSGTDFAPVPRYPGLTRSYWHREGKRVIVHYEGRADFAAVLGHYVQGFTALGFSQEIQSATPEAEVHAWFKAEQHYLATIASEPKGVISVHIETTLK